jgi:hypothetical protein
MIQKSGQIETWKYGLKLLAVVTDRWFNVCTRLGSRPAIAWRHTSPGMKSLGTGELSIHHTQNAVFWDVAQVVCYWLHFSSAHILTSLKIKAIFSSEMSALTIYTRGHKPEDDILHGHCCKNLKSYTALIGWPCNGEVMCFLWGMNWVYISQKTIFLIVGQLDQGFPWFSLVPEQILSWYPKFHVALYASHAALPRVISKFSPNAAR